MTTESTTFGIGIVGCGTISGTHAEAVAQAERGRLVAGHSRNKSRVDEFCSRYGGTGYTDYEEFLSHPGLDIVVICTPSGTHLDYGSRAARAGKHLIVEKPIEVSLKRGRKLIKSCRQNNTKLAVIYQNRFIDDVIKMKQVIDGGELGRIFMVDASVKWYRDQEYYDSGGWRGTLDLDGGGAVINQAIHTIDLMVWFCGLPESLQGFKGTLTHAGIEGEDNAVATLQFKNGAIGTFRASTSVVPPEDRKIEVHGTDGTAVLDGDIFRLKNGEGDSAGENESSGAGASSPMAGMTANHHGRQYEQILDAFAGNGEPVVSGEESLRSLAVVEALYASAEKQKVIQMDEYLNIENMDRYDEK